ncbi:hypothetical protein HAX54_014481, partial [Datura stramonium]|nr:hypothetical protein [Datura stramonium]
QQVGYNDSGIYRLHSTYDEEFVDEYQNPFSLGFNIACWGIFGSITFGKSPPEGISGALDMITPKQMAVEGCKAQSAMMGLMKKRPSIKPFAVYIANEEKLFEVQRENLYDPIKDTIAIIDEEYRKQCAANGVGSKGKFQLIQRNGLLGN